MKKNLIMKKEYIKPFVNVKVMESVLMIPVSGGATPEDPGSAGSKEMLEFLLDEM